MTFTTKELHEVAGLNSDGVSGFLAQVSLGKFKLEALWPEHLKGKRVDDFRYGSEIARWWMHARHARATARRVARNRDFKEIGATSLLRPEGDELKAERLDTLRETVRIFGRKPNPPPQPHNKPAPARSACHPLVTGRHI